MSTDITQAMQLLCKQMEQLSKDYQDNIARISAEQRIFMETVLRSNQQLPSISSVPSFAVFNKSNDRWESYLLRINQHFEANKVEDDDQKRAYFLSWVGSETFELLQKLFGSSDIGKESYINLVTKLSTHFIAKAHILAARYEFNRTQMKAGQSYADWVADLRGIARDCRFVCGKLDCNESFVDSLIRDMLILHTPHDQVRNSALQHLNPSLEDVLKIAEAFEATFRTVQTIKGASEPAPTVNQMKSSYKNSKRSSSRARPQFPCVDSAAKSCSDCGTKHKRRDCRFRNVNCRYCKKSGHIDTVCFSKANASKSQAHNYKFKPKKNDEALIIEMSSNVESLNTCQLQIGPKIMVPLEINNHQMEFQLDTGATCSLIGIDAYQELGSPVCKPTDKKLKAYGNAPVPVKGLIEVKVKLGSKVLVLPLLVTNSKNGGKIFGMDWFQAFDFYINDQVQNLLHVNPDTSKDVQCLQSVEALCQKHSALFKSELGRCNSFKATLHLKQGAIPKFFKPRPIPFSQLEAVKTEIDRLVAKEIWKPVKRSNWAAPIVVVPKPNGSIRICGDFKVTVNSQLEVDQYPIPRPEELFHKLRNGQHFSKIDLADAFLQVELDDESKNLVVLNTSQGLFQFQRLPFGIASSPAIFQRLIEQIISGLPGCASYLDDIIVTAETTKDHLKLLDEVFTRLEENGLRCNKEKCKFFAPEVEYLGYVISSEGLRPSDTGIEAVKNLPQPKNLSEIQSFLGKVNYYNKFIDGFSQISAPLNMLRKKNAKFFWNKDQEQAFQELKSRIVEATKLVHYRPEYPLILATDASSYGIGAVISHSYPDGSEKPIAFASKTLDDHQKRYSQIEKEALSIIFGVKKFHQYLYGRRFKLITDHKPLISIFHPDKHLPVMTAHRLQRWAITLMSYSYDICYRETTKHANADALSRLPVGPDWDFDNLEEICNQIEEELEDTLSVFPVDAVKISKETSKDKVLQKVCCYVTNGWPNHLPKDEDFLRPFFERRYALRFHEGVLLFQANNTRVVVPLSLQKHVVQMLHQGHWGIVRMKQLARKYCYWPQMNSEIEVSVSRCENCQSSSASPKADYLSWPEVTEPWERLHIDYAGPFFNSSWFICVDAYSKFPFVLEMRSTTTEATIEALQQIFVLEGLPKTIVSDNGTQFVSGKFQEFCNTHGIQHITTAPFHPASNGRAERFVRTFKSAMLKAQYGNKGNKQASLQSLLVTYRATPNPVTNKSPSELLHGRQPRTLLSLLLPSVKVANSAQPKKFGVNDNVFAKNFYGGAKWMPGKIVKTIGNMMYLVETSRGVWKRHQNQLRKSSVLKTTPEPTSILIPGIFDDSISINVPIPINPPIEVHGQDIEPPEKQPMVLQPPYRELRRSKRATKPVVHFQAGRDSLNKIVVEECCVLTPDASARCLCFHGDEWNENRTTQLAAMTLVSN